MYRPMALFASVSAVFGVVGLIPFVRYLVLLWADTGGNHLQSLILGIVLHHHGACCRSRSASWPTSPGMNRTLAEEQLDLQKLQRYGD